MRNTVFAAISLAAAALATMPASAQDLEKPAIVIDGAGRPAPASGAGTAVLRGHLPSPAPSGGISGSSTPPPAGTAILRGGARLARPLVPEIVPGRGPAVEPGDLSCLSANPPCR